MTAEGFRILMVVGVLVGAGLVAYVFSRFRRLPHPDVLIGGEGDRPGIVLFTSLDCSSCKETIAQLRGAGIPFREITHELEPQRFESWGVRAVPLTVVIDKNSETVDTMTGVPPHRRLTKAIDIAGIEAGS